MKASGYKYIYLFFVIITPLLFIKCNKEVFVEPQSDLQNTSYQSLYINSSPTGATIYVNGRTTGQVTPDTVKWLNEGNYQITLKKKYFWDTTFSITAQKGITQTGFVDYYQSERMLGQIEFNSVPQGAKIYLDNVYTGKVTPATITKLIPKVYNVKFDYPEYRQDSVNITVESKSRLQCAFALEDTLDVVTYNQINSKLPTNYFTCVNEDMEGNIWFGTLGSGLVKFDGKKFTTYNQNNSSFVLSDYTNYIKQGKDGALWVAFSNGIGKYYNHNWDVSFKTNWINSLNISPDNVVLAAVDRGGGIIRHSNNGFELLTQEKGDIPNNFVATACYDKQDNLWIGRIKDGIDLLSNGAWTHLDSIRNGLPNSNVRILDILEDGTLVGLFHYMYDAKAGTSYCTLARFINNQWIAYYNFLMKLDIMRTSIDKKERMWIGGGSRIARVNGVSSISYIQQIVLQSAIRKYRTNDTTINSEYISADCALADSQGNLWLLVPSKGIIKVKKGRWAD